MRAWQWLVVVVLGLGLLAVLFLREGMLLPKQLQPNVLSLTVEPISGDATSQQVVLKLRNDSDATVEVWPAAELHLGQPDRFEIQGVQVTAQTIAAGETATLELTVPSETGWQVAVRVGWEGDDVATVVFSDWSLPKGEEVQVDEVVSEGR